MDVATFSYQRLTTSSFLWWKQSPTHLTNIHLLIPCRVAVMAMIIVFCGWGSIHSMVRYLPGATQLDYREAQTVFQGPGSKSYVLHHILCPSNSQTHTLKYGDDADPRVKERNDLYLILGCFNYWGTGIFQNLKFLYKASSLFLHPGQLFNMVAVCT